MRSNVIIVGMARSGTSLTASIFARHGYFVSAEPDRELQDPDKFNPGGYWELASMVEANARLFKAVGFNRHNTWTFDEIETQQAEGIASVHPHQEDIDLANIYEANQPWVWKDPRFCYTLGYWWPLVSQENTKILLVTRNSRDIWRSFRRNKWSTDVLEDKSSFIRRIEDHIAFARQTIRRLDIPCLEIDYGDYANKPEELAAEISDVFGLDLSPDDLGYKKQLNNATTRGIITSAIEKLAALLPKPARKLLKKAIPDFIARKLFPTISKS